MEGILDDGKGIPCVFCHETGLIDEGEREKECEECAGGGRFRIDTEALELVPEDEIRDLVEVVQLMRWTVERNPLPNEWLEQPYMFVECFHRLRGWIFGEFKDRSEEKRRGEQNS